MTRLAAVLVALAAASLPAWCAASEGRPVAIVGAPVAAEASGAASVLHPAVLRASFQVPRTDTALYLGASWYVRDLSVTVVGPGGRRVTIVATSELPGRMLGLRLPSDAWQADRVELEATTVSTATAPYLLPAEQLARIGWRNWSYAALFGLFAAVALLNAILAIVRRSRAGAWFAAATAAQAALLVPWLGIVRPPPQLSQPLHAVLHAAAFAAIAAFALVFFESARLPRFTAPALWVLVALDAVAVAGGDVLQDLWTIPDVLTQTLAVALALALIVPGIIGIRRGVDGAPYYVAGTALAAFGLLAGNLSLHLAELPPFAVSGSALEALLLALAVAPAAQPRVQQPQTQLSVPPDAVPAAQLDGLTGIANRIALDACLAIAWSRGRRAQSPLAALIVDVDHFRTYNQTYGHLAGDDILRRIADALATIAGRRDDLAGRHGGDKFLVLLPDTDLTGAQRLGDAVRAAVFALEAAHGAVPSKRVTVSVGVASLVPDDGSDGAELVRRAGIALHIAKTMGRNRVVADEPIAPPITP